MVDNVLLLASMSISDILAKKSERLNRCEQDTLIKALTIIMTLKAQEDRKLARGEEKGC